ncbi:hypothetical protein ACFVTY_28820 [Streptomyces sp. NPDC058067]|uniref:hypothetical protein n=1 Tax=Streptomyces sp. NPDC058067 TaxID=3346324 RepID=UPI0036EC8891
MSRETDSSSSGPQGRGGAAYPSGTPPYGTPAQGDGAPGDAGQSADGRPAPEERKTETTLTTRIRINIPGSRPIPPVVMRTPMSDVNAGPGAQDAAPAETPPPLPVRPTDPASRTAPSGDGRNAAPAGQGGEEKASDWFAPRKSGPPPRGASANGAGASATGPGAGNSGAVPGPSSGAGGSGAFDVSGAVEAGPLGASGQNQPPRPGNSGDPHRGDLPYFSGNADGTGPGVPPHGPNGPHGPTGPNGPTGPTTGPVGGDSPMTRPQGPAAPGGQRPPQMSDDTAILTPQKPAPEPGSGSGSGQVSGDTLTSGIPVVPPGLGGPNAPFAAGPRADGAGPHTPPKLPDPVGQGAPAAGPRKKGRSKLVLLGGGVVALAGVAYGAGLLMNHADVPKGTTVLGVDIGGGTRDEATAKLDAAFGKRTTEPLQLSVDGKSVALKPDQAGLSLDSTATVAAAAGSDYNPVSVIGSLFGNERVVDPVMPVDEEKLQAALERAAGGASSGDGTIKFVPGKAVAVYGKTGKGIDVARSSSSVEEAYRAHVETGVSRPVPMATTTRTPTVPNAEVDRMMKEFAEPAMSANVIIKAGGKEIPFGPAKSLPQILGVKAIDGKLVDVYDLEAVKKLYGNTFDGVLITRATGKKTPVTPQDVVGVMRMALKGKTPAERIGVIQTNPN